MKLDEKKKKNIIARAMELCTAGNKLEARPAVEKALDMVVGVDSLAERTMYFRWALKTVEVILEKRQERELRRKNQLDLDIGEEKKPEEKKDFLSPEELAEEMRKLSERFGKN